MFGVIFKSFGYTSVKRTSKRISSGAITSVKMIRCQNLRCCAFFIPLFIAICDHALTMTDPVAVLTS